MNKIANRTENESQFSNISHFDPRFVAESICKYCRLPAHNEMMASEDLCVFCTKELTITSTENLISRFILPSLLLAISILFIPLFDQFSILLPFLALIIFYPMITGSKYIRLRIYRNFDINLTLCHILTYYNKNKDRPNLNEKMYINKFNELIEAGLDTRVELRNIVLYYLVEYIMLGNTSRDKEYLELWAKGFDLEVEEMLEIMFEITNIEEGFGFTKGRGLLPEVWEYIVNNQELIDKILETLLVAVRDLDSASEPQKQMFLEDLYLIDEELLEKISENNKWEDIKTALSGFEPETPPKSFFESIQAQALENQRMIEARKQQQIAKNNSGNTNEGNNVK